MRAYCAAHVRVAKCQQRPQLTGLLPLPRARARTATGAGTATGVIRRACTAGTAEVAGEARPRRSVLYMPGSNTRAINKARSLPVRRSGRNPAPRVRTASHRESLPAADRRGRA